MRGWSKQLEFCLWDWEGKSLHPNFCAASPDLLLPQRIASYLDLLQDNSWDQHRTFKPWRSPTWELGIFSDKAQKYEQADDMVTLSWPLFGGSYPCSDLESFYKTRKQKFRTVGKPPSWAQLREVSCNRKQAAPRWSESLAGKAVIQAKESGE